MAVQQDLNVPMVAEGATDAVVFNGDFGVAALEQSAGLVGVAQGGTDGLDHPGFSLAHGGVPSGVNRRLAWIESRCQQDGDREH